MARFVLAAFLALSTTASYAERPSTLGMSCGQAQHLVAARGAVVMSTGRHTYDRFVAHAGFCTFGEYAYYASAPTKDTPSCPLGYICKTTPPIWMDDDDDFFFGR